MKANNTLHSAEQADQSQPFKGIYGNGVRSEEQMSS